MADERLRELERQAAQGDPRAQVQLIRSRLRVGSLDKDKLATAALLGDPAAREASDERWASRLVPHWSEPDEYWPTLIRDLGRAACWPTGELMVCPYHDADEPDVKPQTREAFDPRLDCDVCYGTGSIDVGASRETLFRAALTAAHACLVDYTEDWLGQREAIVAIVCAAEGWLDEYAQRSGQVGQWMRSVFARSVVRVAHEANSRFTERYVATPRGVIQYGAQPEALPQWCRFHEFFESDSLGEEFAWSGSPTDQWLYVANQLLYAAGRARDRTPELLRAQLRLVLVPWLLS